MVTSPSSAIIIIRELLQSPSWVLSINGPVVFDKELPSGKQSAQAEEQWAVLRSAQT